MTDTDVLIVGAGPTGLALAVALRANNVRATVVDRLTAGANTSRAAAVSARTLEVLEPVGVSNRLVKQGIQAPLFTIRDGHRTLIPVDFSWLPTRYPYILMAPQSTTERLLLERLTELGGEVVRPKTLTGITQDAQGITAQFDDGEPIRAQYLVGADGMHSVVREQAGIGFHGGQYGESFALADVRLTGEVTDDEVILFWASDGMTVVAPLPGGTYRIVAPVDEAPELPSAGFIQEMLDARGFGPGRVTVTDVAWGSRFRVHHRIADSYRASRVLLAGDAAHVHSPAGGQGMNLGIQDSIALSEALTTALTTGRDAVLDEYSAARRPLAQKVVTLTDRLTRLATLPAAARPIRNVMTTVAGKIPGVQHQLAWQLSGLGNR
ncbi:FAD-dependent monooxygenase [Mycobacterium sp. OTB74]|uniref:FAD-dependent monooxygenase n=1 Tax=Mycobacterium sp. OTB74 TaxID=1853452 RepID=UPI002474CDC7|nr:FAD-dependent monooxygenase [Mycobacterium sp. OTB74]MDH6243036.1 2-polyprenyl-6-methoxyphenol hydroxylase-like FAD-dependent oxidoreductase [Mycobacterium sp. OTB74]